MIDREGALDRQDLDVKDRADRALRTGNAAEALPLYTSLLRNVAVLEGGVYENWLDGVSAPPSPICRTCRVQGECVVLRSALASPTASGVEGRSGNGAA